MVGFFFIMISLLKFITASKMMIMLISLEVNSVFLFFCLVLMSGLGSGMFVSIFSVLLVFLVMESVIVLLGMVNIFRKGSLMTKSLSVLKF